MTSALKICKATLTPTCNTVGGLIYIQIQLDPFRWGRWITGFFMNTVWYMVVLRFIHGLNIFVSCKYTPYEIVNKSIKRRDGVEKRAQAFRPTPFVRRFKACPGNVHSQRFVQFSTLCEHNFFPKSRRKFPSNHLIGSKMTWLHSHDLVRTDCTKSVSFWLSSVDFSRDTTLCMEGNMLGLHRANSVAVSGVSDEDIWVVPSLMCVSTRDIMWPE